MVLICYILVAIVICFLNTQSVEFKENSSSHWRKNIINSLNQSDEAKIDDTFNKVNKTYMPPQNLRFKGDNKIYDLKSNIFDKILSDEILTIQKKLYKKDMTHTLPAYTVTSGNNAPTPTLEIKQRWSVMNFMSKALNESHTYVECKSHNESSKKISTQSGTWTSRCCSHNLKDKVLGLRSLSDIKSNAATMVYQDTMKLCTCMNMNTNRRCNHRCTGPKSKKEFETLPSNTKYYCSRFVKSSPLIPSIIPSDIVHEPYFYTNMPFSFYYPLVITDVPRKKSERRKTKKPYEHHLYYDSNSGEKINEEDINQDFFYNYDDDGYEDNDKFKIVVGNYKNKPKPPKVEHVAINIQYEDGKILETNNDDMEEQNKIDDVLSKGEIQVLNKNGFVNEIVDDLKKFYNNVIIKDCYCSSSIVNFVTFQYLFVLNIFVLF